MKKKLTLLCFRKESIIKILLRMKLLTFFMLIGITLVSAKSYSHLTTLTFNLDNLTVCQVFKEIEKNSDYILIYNEKTLDINRKVTVRAKNDNIETILDQVFAGTKNSYEISGQQIVITVSDIEPVIIDTKTYTTELQQVTVSGTVTDQQMTPLAGVTVLVKGTNVGILTDATGKYSLANVPQNATLVFSFIGMQTQEILLTGQTRIDVVLKEATLGLEEVVVVGYGVQKKATVTGAIAAVETRSLVQSPQANISNSLVGRMTGLIAVQREGQPGGDQATIRIRGAGTFSGSTDPLIMVDGIESLNYNNIDPNEIENITILKDASATAVYGVRGANGVLLITTKRGTKGNPVFSATSSTAITAFNDLRKNLSSYEWAKNFNEGLRYNSYITGSYTPKFTDEDIEHYRTGDDPIFHPSTDWASVLLRSYSSQSQVNLNVRGGSDLIKYFISGGYFNQIGLFNTVKTNESGFDSQMKFKRYNFRSNFDFNVTKRFSINLDMSSQIEVRTGPQVSTSYLMDHLFLTPPNNSPGIVDGKIINVYDVFSGNPLELMLGGGFSNQSSNYLTSSVRFNYSLDDITKGLTAHGTISYWNKAINNKSYSKDVQTYKPFLLADNSIQYAPQKAEAPFIYSESGVINRKTYIEFGFNYARQFGSHSITGLILYNQSKLYDPSLDYVVPNGYQGIVGRATYDYDGRYLAEFNLGYNGTENFAPGKRFGFFPAYSLGWVVSKEPFFPKNNIVGFVKIRGSYGEVGNDKIGGNRFLYRPGSYSYTGSYAFGEVGSTYQDYRASEEGLQGNPNLTWERAKKMNIGADVYFWKDKIKVIVDYFVERRDNILTTPQTTTHLVGIVLPAQNWGKMKNSGYEVEVNFTNNIGKFTYWIKSNFTYAHNVVIFQDEVKHSFSYQDRTGKTSGQPFGLSIEGFYNTWEEVIDAYRPRSSLQNNYIMPGDFRYKDINGDGRIDSYDQVPLGYPSFPEISYGVSFGGSYKGFDFSVLFQGATNVSITPYIGYTFRGYDNDQSCAAYVPELCWTPERYASGEEIRLPHLSAQMVQNYDFQSNNMTIMDGTYLRLKNAEIGFTFSNTFLKKMSISSCRAYANCNNLLTWSDMLPGLDPEQITTMGDYAPYPNTRTLNLGFNIKF